MVGNGGCHLFLPLEALARSEWYKLTKPAVLASRTTRNADDGGCFPPLGIQYGPRGDDLRTTTKVVEIVPDHLAHHWHAEGIQSKVGDDKLNQTRMELVDGL